MDNLIPIRKASFYLEDREAISRVKCLYCYIRRFANELEECEIGRADASDESDFTSIGEVYLSGLLKIDSDHTDDYFISELSDEHFEPIITMIEGTINGKLCNDTNRKFLTTITEEDVYVCLNDITELSDQFGIPKNKNFNDKHIKSLDNIIDEYCPEDHQVYLPDDLEELDEIMNFYDESDKDNNDKIVEKKIHGNTRLNALKREQILGCTMAMIIADPSIIKKNTKSTDLTNALELKSEYFWRTGAPPLAHTTLNDLYRIWLRLVPTLTSESRNKEPPFEGGNE